MLQCVMAILVTFRFGLQRKIRRRRLLLHLGGSFCYRVMPFGLLNAYASFQRWANWVFTPFLGKSLRVFMDDFCIYSSQLLHVERVDEVFGKLDRDGGPLNPGGFIGS